MQLGQALVGHPVNVATGILHAARRDISVRGKVALTWDRLYSTGILQLPPSPLGAGWTNRYFTTLTKGENEFRLSPPEGAIETFADPDGMVDRGGIVRNLGTFQEINKRDSCYIVTRWNVDSGEVERYVFKEGPRGASMPLVRIEDASGHALDMHHDNAGRLTHIRQRLEKRTLFLEYSNGNRIKSVSFQLLNGERRVLARYDHDQQGRLVVAYDALGYADRYEYESNSRMTREIVKDGSVFHFAYDDKGRCVKTSGLDRYDEKTLRFYDSISWTEVTDSLGNVTRYQYLPTGQVVCEIGPTGARKTTEYDSFGRIEGKIDANGAETRYEYDDYGNRSKIINPLGENVTIFFNDAHLPIRIVDPAGNSWIRRYDRGFRLTAMVDALNHEWLFEYDRDDMVSKITDPNRNSKHFNYSRDYTVLEINDWTGHKTEYRYDDFGNVVQYKDPLGGVTKIRYNLLNCPLEMTFTDGARIVWSYDSGSNPTSVTDGNGNTTRYRFGPCRRLLEKIDPIGNIIRYQWGTEPRTLQKVTNANGEIYELIRDSEQRIVHEKGFDGREMRFEYDAAGHCIAFINGEQERVIFKRDLLGNLTERILPDDSTTKFEYDCWGNIIRASSASCELQFTRDPLGRVIEELQAGNRIVRHYDFLGRCVGIETSLGCVATYSFNAAGGLLSLKADNRCTLDLHRNGLNLETARIFQKRAAFEQSFDALGLPSTQRLVKSSSSSEFRSEGVLYSATEFDLARSNLGRRYRYNRKGQLERVEESSGSTHRYAYDASGRIIQETVNNNAFDTFSYDRAGNLTSVVGKSNNEVLDYSQGGRLERQPGVRYEYDGNGRLTKKVLYLGQPEQQVWEFGWNAIDQLVSVKTPDQGTWSYEYDPFGRRILKRGPAKEIKFVWNRDVIFHTIEDGSLSSTWFFEPSSFKLLCTLQKSKAGLVITDHLGTPREIVDEFGEVLWSARLSAWGLAREVKANGIDCPFRFPGQWFDGETHLHYNRFRYYDPRCGRYISQDPVGLSGGLNFYRYLLDPVNSLDPFGLVDPWDISFSHPLPQDPSLTFTDPNSPWCGKTVCDAVAQARQTGQLPPGLSIEAQEVNGKLVAVNNRTLWVAQQANLSDVEVHDEGGDTFHKLQRNFRDSGLGGPVDPEDMTGPECGKK